MPTTVQLQISVRVRYGLVPVVIVTWWLVELTYLPRVKFKHMEASQAKPAAAARGSV